MPAVDEPVNVLEVLDGMIFPATIVELVSYAQDNGASEEVLDRIQGIPERNYESIHDVALHLGRIEHLPADTNLWSSAPSDELFTDEEPPRDTENHQR